MLQGKVLNIIDETEREVEDCVVERKKAQGEGEKVPSLLPDISQSLVVSDELIGELGKDVAPKTGATDDCLSNERAQSSPDS